MKNRGLIIFLIVILSIFAIAILFGMFFVLFGNVNFKFHNLHSSSVSDKLVYEKVYDTVFDDISINSDAGDIYIKKSNRDEVEVKIYGEVKQLDVQDESNLSIKYVSKKCIGFCFNVVKAKIEITLPSDYDGNINIENKFGDTKMGEFLNAHVDVKHEFGDISIDGAKKGKIINNCGDIDLGTFSYAEVENNYGDINIKEILSSFNIEADCGDIEIRRLNIDESSSIKNSLGDVEIGNTNEIRIDAHTSLGDVEIKNNNHKSDVVLSIDNSCGDITVNN